MEITIRNSIRTDDFVALGKEIYNLFLDDDIAGLDKVRTEIHYYLDEMRHTHMIPFIYNGMYRYLADYCSHAIPAIESGDWTQIVFDIVGEEKFIQHKQLGFMEAYVSNNPDINIEYWYVWGYNMDYMNEGDN